MRSKKNVETTKLDAGETLKKNFDNYAEMATSAVDWTLFCSYQLKPNFSEGIHKIIQLPSMQIASTDMSGGIMFDYISPKNCITFSILKKISKKACIDQMKLETGMIVIIDDTKKYNFMCSDSVVLFDISLNQNADPLLIEKLKKAVDKYYLDNDQKIATLIKSIIDTYDEDATLDTQTSIRIETEITKTILTLLEAQEAQTPYFTRSEMIALEIKRKLFKHMDGKMSVNSVSKEYTISAKSLQNAFRSLFDLTPNKFMRLLKLNLVHHELIQSNSHMTSVQRIARKWGFTHMGRFSKYYTDLFGENPSVSLKTDLQQIDGMKVHCVERKEEML
jgi:AraC-like DNA-binding protein